LDLPAAMVTQDAPKEVGGPFWDQRIIP
jgi:hypothetical protein